MRMGALVTGCACAVALLAAPAVAFAAPPITSQLNGCPAYSSDTGEPVDPAGPRDVRICSGQVPSYDGSRLDVDVTLPMTGGAGHPLIVMLHGFGNNKHEWESHSDEGDGADKYHWNNRWFAEHGFYVVNYTARGFRDDGPSDASQPNTPSFSSADVPNGTIRVKSRDIEVKDTQYLAALVADAFPDVDPTQVAVTGGSYGGGESWVQASQSTWTFPHEHDDSLPVLQLQVAVPKYPWTDLAYALAPNGHPGGPSSRDAEGNDVYEPLGSDIYESSQGRPNSPTGDGNPIGVAKASYITGLFAVGASRGVFEEGQAPNTGTEGPVNIPAWNTRIVGLGDPYDAGAFPVEDPEDAIVKQARRGLTEYRSAYYQDEAWAKQKQGRKVAVFSIQGWTDDLFEAVESFRMFKYLKRLDPRWPVEVALADVGHSRAQNNPAPWRRLNQQAWQWMQANIQGSHEQQTTVSSQPTLCANDGDSDHNDAAAQELTATTPEGLANGTLTVKISGAKTLTNASGAEDRDNARTDPVAGGIDSALTGGGGPCRASTNFPAPTRFTAVSEPLSGARTYVGLGYVSIPYHYAGTAGTLATRVWDIAPDGSTLLVTRGVYRLNAPASDPLTGTLRLPLYGNHWPLKPGHRIRLDLQEADTSTFRFNNLPNSFTFSDPQLVLPTRQSGDTPLHATGE